MKQKLTELGRKIIQQAENVSISVSIMEKTTRQKINKEKEEHHKPTRHSRCSIIRSRIYILFICTRNVLQDRPFVRPYNKSQ